MTKSEMFKKAWAIVKTLEGDLHARLSMALQQVWVEFKASKVVDMLVSFGGKIWDKKGQRIYISRIWKNIFEVEVSYYKRSGFLQSFYLDGEHWSNTQARRLMDCFESAYYDVEKAKWVGMDSYAWVFNTKL